MRRGKTGFIERLPYITRINKAGLAAMAERMGIHEDLVIEMALARTYLALFEGEPAPARGDEGISFETRRTTDAAFLAAPEPLPAPRSPSSANLLELLRSTKSEDKPEDRE